MSTRKAATSKPFWEYALLPAAHFARLEPIINDEKLVAWQANERAEHAEHRTSDRTWHIYCGLAYSRTILVCNRLTFCITLASAKQTQLVARGQSISLRKQPVAHTHTHTQRQLNGCSGCFVVTAAYYGIYYFAFCSFAHSLPYYVAVAVRLSDRIEMFNESIAASYP